MGGSEKASYRLMVESRSSERAPVSHVLVVDDDAGTLQTFGTILRLAGHDVALALTGREGIWLARRLGLDLIVADHRLPDIEGLDILRRLRQLSDDVSFVLVTAFGTRELELEAASLGAAYLEKPVFDAHLLEVVRSCSRPRASVRAFDRSSTDDRMRSRERPSGPDEDLRLAGHAATRWANLVMIVVRSHTDVPTLVQWGRMSGHGQTTLKTRCVAAGPSAGDSLDFARALRVVTRYNGHVCEWYNALDILDRRTLKPFLVRVGLPMDAPVPDLPTYLRMQHLVTSQALLSAVCAQLGLSA